MTGVSLEMPSVVHTDEFFYLSWIVWKHFPCIPICLTSVEVHHAKHYQKLSGNQQGTILDADIFVNDLSQNEYVVGRPKPFSETSLLF